MSSHNSAYSFIGSALLSRTSASFSLRMPMKRFIITRQMRSVEEKKKNVSIRLMPLYNKLKSPKAFVNTFVAK
jgi:hypothetical protein